MIVARRGIQVVEFRRSLHSRRLACFCVGPRGREGRSLLVESYVGVGSGEH